MLKTIKKLILISSIVVFAGCDKDLVEVNTDPYAVTTIDPAILFAGAQRIHLGTWYTEHTIVQQYVVPYNTGATVAFNFNEDIDLTNNAKWTASYTNSVKNLVEALNLLGPTTDRVNLKSMIRISKAQTFMDLADTYGDVPYFEAGKAVSDLIFFPKYDDDAAIYEDLYKEIKEAVAAFKPDGDAVSADLFYGPKAQPSTRTANTADQIAKWKKLGNSLLLRLGMRYSKVNPQKAADIVAEALAGGVMTSNADNAYVKYDGSLFTIADNLSLTANTPHFNYAAEPFVNQLKATRDPRARFILANFLNPGKPTEEPNPDTVLANQFGVPIGVTDAQITAAGSPYRGIRAGGLNYSQFNIWSVASPAAPEFYVTYAQTSLLLAEAAKRGWIPGGDVAAQTYYENAIRADMEVYAFYPKGTVPSSADINAYLLQPGVAYNSTDALKLINTQYWVVNIRTGTEAFANFRRSGYPLLNPNLSNNKLNGGFARRLTYPDVEASSNAQNYSAAAAAIGGDKLTSRVFWDTDTTP